MNLRERVEAALDLSTADPVWLQLLDEACRAEAQLRDLEALVQSDGLLSTGSKGQTVVHPAVPELRHQRAAYARLLGQLGVADSETFSERQRRYARMRSGQ